MLQKNFLARFDEFCNSLSKKDRIAIVFHGDSDGICAAAIAAKAIFKLIGKKPAFASDFHYGNKAKEEKIIGMMKNKKINKLLILDLAMANPREKLKKADFIETIAVIDHHEFQEDFHSKKTIFLNSKFFSKKPSTYPASKLCFDLASKKTNMEEADWIACIGIIGDYAQKSWPEFMEKAIKRNKTSLAKLEKLEEIVSAVTVTKKPSVSELFRALSNAKKPGDIKKKEFLKAFEEFESEKKRVLEHINEDSQIFEELELHIYNIKTRFPAIKSQVINELSRQMPNKTIIVTEPTGQMSRFSARRGDFKVKVNKLLENSIKGIPDSAAGGHVPAAAGRVPKQFFNQFIEQLITEAGEKNA